MLRELRLRVRLEAEDSVLDSLWTSVSGGLEVMLIDDDNGAVPEESEGSRLRWIVILADGFRLLRPDMDPGAEAADLLCEWPKEGLGEAT